LTGRFGSIVVASHLNLAIRRPNSAGGCRVAKYGRVLATRLPPGGNMGLSAVFEFQLFAEFFGI
jgi:hypothetical protein